MTETHQPANLPRTATVRLPFLMASAVLFLATLIFYAREQTPTIIRMMFTDGLVAEAWIFSAAMLGFGVLQLMRVDVDGLLEIVTSAGVGLGLYSLALLGLGLTGSLSRTVVMGFVVAGVGVGIAGIIWKRRHRSRERVRPASSAKLQWLWLVVVPFLGISIVGACLLPGTLWRPSDPHPYDVLVYHLQVPREWYEAERIIPLTHNVYSFFPFNAEMHFLAAMYLRGGPWAGMYTAQFMSVGFSILSVLAIFAGASEVVWRRNQGAATLAATAVAVLPWIVMVSCVTYVESLLIFYATLTIVWALRAMKSSKPLKSLLIAGLMAGFASGVKLPAVAMLLLPVPVAITVASLIGRRFSRHVLAGCIAFVLAGLVVLSPWLARNAVWTGNPLFPLAMNTLGHGYFSSVQVERFILAHSPPPNERSFPARILAAGDQILWNWQFAYLFWPIVALAVASQWRRRGTVVALFIMASMLVTWMFFTHLMGRFFFMAIPVAAMMIAQLRSKRLIQLAAVGVIFMAALSFSGMQPIFGKWAAAGRDGVFGIQDIEPMLPEMVERIEREGSGPIYMVGDVQAFLHQIPMSRLRYRTMFDLDTSGANPALGRDVLSAWVGAPLESLPPGTPVYIDSQELLRLSQTYYNVPKLPEDVPGPRDRPFFIGTGSQR